MVMWIIGMSGAGKSFIGRQVYARRKQTHPATVLLDGDEIRELFAHDRGSEPYTVEGRRQNANRIRAFCTLLDKQGIDVICCILSIFEENHRANRAEFSRYAEVFLDAPYAVLRQRNPKDLYRRAEAGQMSSVVGVDIPFTPPQSPDLTLVNGDPPLDLESAVSQICALFERHD